MGDGLCGRAGEASVHKSGLFGITSVLNFVVRKGKTRPRVPLLSSNPLLRGGSTAGQRLALTPTDHAPKHTLSDEEFGNIMFIIMSCM